jgi:hypothetical protein
MSLLELFCHVDDFCKAITTWQIQQLLGPARKPGLKPKLSASEIMTIIIYFHMSQYRNFKSYYIEYVMKHLRSEFPDLARKYMTPIGGGEIVSFQVVLIRDGVTQVMVTSKPTLRLALVDNGRILKNVETISSYLELQEQQRVS